MHCLSSLLLVALSLVPLSSAESLPSRYNVHEKRTHIPPGWTLTKRHDPASTIPLRFALKQRNIQDIENYLYDVSHPDSPNYGKHWSAGDVVRTFAPTGETVGTVRTWLIASGIGEERISLGRTKGWLQANVTVEEAEQLINTTYNVYTHLSGKEHVACEVYHLPEHVQPHVDFVIPSVHFDAKLSRRSGDDDKGSHPTRNVGKSGFGVGPRTADTIPGAIGELKECNKHITPICLRMLYGLFYDPVATDKNSYGIVEYPPGAYMQSDIQLFARNYATDLIGKEPFLVSIDGDFAQTAYQNSIFNLESDIDLQYGMSLVTGKQTVTLYQTGDMAEGASFNNFLDAIDGSYCTHDGGDDPTHDPTYPDPLSGGYKGPEACGTVKPTYVISTSYGYNEADFTPFYAERQCAEYAKLGLMGTTVLYSSGDHGVAGIHGACLNSSHMRSGSGTVFNPSFPGTCPFVTSVGATMVKPNTSVSDPESAVMKMVHSGGGFSNYFKMPQYQKDAVVSYLKDHSPDYPSSIWNSTGTSRGYPDISANGAKYVVAVNGKFELSYGTSCSAAVVGAILTMINDARLATGKSPIGFINPAIYSTKFARGFNDITEGNNPGCGTAGYAAAGGWDPVTGLGTPNFPELLKLWT